MIRFGPSGNPVAFYDAGYKHTYEVFAWIADMGLNAYEYSFGRGVRVKEDTASKIRNQAEKHGVALSVHAPYFINLASEDEEKFLKNADYFLESAKAANWLGADRVIFHPGSCAKMDRDIAMEYTCRNLKRMMEVLDQNGYATLTFCPETMGKVNQIGSLQEIITLSNLDERIIPTIDFGHLHTRDNGALNTEEDFEQVITQLIEGIGFERTKQMHVHFSKIEYTAKGEKAHRTFDDEGFGPDFALLAPVLKKHALEPRILCESSGTMAKDALTMKQLYEALA